MLVKQNDSYKSACVFGRTSLLDGTYRSDLTSKNHPIWDHPAPHLAAFMQGINMKLKSISIFAILTLYYNITLCVAEEPKSYFLLGITIGLEIVGC